MKAERLNYGKPPLGYEAEGWETRSERSRMIVWAHYKAEHDPPGMTIESFRARVLGLPDPEARAAAWAWHDRRLALWQRLADAEVVMRTFLVEDLWPRCLGWTDDEVTTVERWLLDSTAEMPEVLS